MLRRKPLAGVTLALLSAVACSSSVAPAPGKSSTVAVPEGARAVHAIVAHRDGRLGVPSFVWIHGAPPVSATTDAASVAASTLGDLAGTLKLSEPARLAVGAPEIHDAGAGGIVARFHQRVAGREVFRGQLTLMLKRDLSPVAAAGFLAPSLRGSNAVAKLAPDAALQAAARVLLGRDLPGAVASVVGGSHEQEEVAFTAPELAQPARVKTVLFPQADGVELAYRVELLLRSGAARSFVVSALDGRTLFQNDLVRNDQYTFRAYASPETLMPLDGPQGNSASPHPTGKPDGFRETFSGAPLVTLQNFPFSKNDPWLPTGAAATTGNNIDAYSDVVSPNGFSASSADLRADAPAANTFDWLYDVTRSPNVTPDSVKGAVTNLFYLTNFMHDWFYDAGFDEKSGNPQQDNYGRGGRGSDRILAEAQDYSGRNNANASTPADGASPRIQMYVFAGQTTADITVNAPAGIAGVKAVGVSGGFGKDSFNVTGSVVLAQDTGGTDPNDACEGLSNGAAVTGKIALVHRGSCSFVQKAQSAQAAGASAVILVNVASSASATRAPFMGGTALDVTIPVLSLNLADGQALEAAIAAGANVTMRREGTVDLDGALDTSIVAHEWGHVLSNRLVSNGDGLTTEQAGGLGEGWSDFVALMVSVRATDLSTPQGANWNGVYPTGSYATSGGGNDSYFGIRRMPYSVDFSKNALTFKHIQDGVPLPAGVPIGFGEDGSNNSEVHNTGEVWASMLWQCYVGLLRDARYSFPQAQERMKRYLVAALKLTPPDPTLLEARDALLAAAYATDEQDLLSFWKAFAKRGAGVGAEGPGKTTAGNKGVKESFEVGNDLQILSATLSDDVVTCDHDGILDEGELGTVTLTLRNSGAGALTATTLKVTSKTPGVAFTVENDGKFPSLKPFESGSVKVKARVTGVRPIESLEVDVDVTDPTLTVARTLHAVVAAHRDADELADSSAIDKVDTVGTSWTSVGTDQTGTTVRWRRVSVGAERWWSVPNAGEPSDLRLTSSSFPVESGTFTLSYKHRWAFESSAEQKKDFDGGVVELSVDGGKTWKDLSEYGTVDYNVTLVNESRGTNPLKGRRAYGNTGPGYPKWVDSSVKVDLGAPSATVQIRFRAGADDNTAEAGWDVDDIAVKDTSAKPFWSLVAHRDACDPNGPTANAGEGKSTVPRATVALQGSATHPKALPLNFKWTQASGPTVQLSGENTANLSFVTPDVAPGTVLGFVLRADDGALLSPASRVDVLVQKGSGGNEPLFAEGGSCGCHTQRGDKASLLSPLALVALTAAFLRRRRR